MVTTSKTEKIFIGNDDKIVELIGKDKETFEADRKQIREQELLQQSELKLQKELKISAYKKLGLTDEEIGAII